MNKIFFKLFYWNELKIKLQIIFKIINIFLSHRIKKTCKYTIESKTYCSKFCIKIHECLCKNCVIIKIIYFQSFLLENPSKFNLVRNLFYIKLYLNIKNGLQYHFILIFYERFAYHWTCSFIYINILSLCSILFCNSQIFKRLYDSNPTYMCVYRSHLF